MAAPRRRTGQRQPTGEKKNVPSGQVHIHSTFNNTIITVTDPTGATLTWAGSGTAGFKVLTRVRHLLLSWLPKAWGARPIASLICDRCMSSSRAPALAERVPSVPCNPRGSRFSQSPTLPRCPTTGAARHPSAESSFSGGADRLLGHAGCPGFGVGHTEG